MGLRPTQGKAKRLGPASALSGTVTLSLSSRPERRDLRFRRPFVEMYFRQRALRSFPLRSKLVSTLRSTRQDAQMNYLSTLSIFMKQTTYLATLPKRSGKLLNSTMVSSHAPNASAMRRRCR